MDQIQEFSQEIVRPYLKTGPRNAVKTNKRKKKSAILTDSPENNALEEQQNKTTKQVKKSKKNMDKNRKECL